MNPILVRVIVGAAVVAAGALAAWLSNRNRPQLHSQRVNQTYTNWEPPPDSSSDTCAVCLDRLGSDRFRLPCKHQLHLHCAKTLFRNRIDSSCPVCRKPVSREFLLQQRVCEYNEIKKEL